MAIEPKLPKQTSFTKKCARCGIVQADEEFAATHSIFYPDGHIPICHSCVNEYLRQASYEWDAVDRLCRWADIPFIVKEWVRLVEMNGEDKAWPVYAKVFAADEYKGIGWEDYYVQYTRLREVGMLEDEVPLVNQEKMKKLSRKWGSNYSDEELFYLEDLYKGLLVTQNVSGALQDDQAKKICKLSLEIDSRIRAGDKDVDKFLSSYDKLVKNAEFTPKNTKNAADFDSFAEVGLWLEKRGRQNKFYDNTTRDIIDETLKNIENYTQRLYINEGGIGDEITQRIKALQNVSESDMNMFDLPQEVDLDAYDNAGFAVAEDSEEFDAEVEVDG